MNVTIYSGQVKLASNQTNTDMKEQSGEKTHLHNKLGHLIRRLHQNMVSTFSEKLTSFDISNVQFAALEAINSLEKCTQKEVADYIAMEPSNMHALLRRLNDRGLISITADRIDPRRNFVQLTKSGWDLLNDMRPKEALVQPALLAKLNKDEQEQFMSLLKRLV